MRFCFDDALRDQIFERLAAFERVMTPQVAPGEHAALDETVLKDAAVAIVIVESAPRSGEAGFLLTRRAESLRGHAGQWALPGGRCDLGESAVQAALRETHEELGLRLASADVLGTLDDYPTRSGYRITPVVAWARASSALAPNAAEVASVHRIPLAEIAHPDAVSFVAIAESARRVVRLRIAGNYVHAPTAAMLYQFGELLNGRHTRVADLEQPVFAWR